MVEARGSNRNVHDHGVSTPTSHSDIEVQCRRRGHSQRLVGMVLVMMMEICGTSGVIFFRYPGGMTDIRAFMGVGDRSRRNRSSDRKKRNSKTHED